MERLELYGGEYPERAVEAPAVVPVDPIGGRELYVREGAVGPSVGDDGADTFGLAEPVHGLYQRVVVGAADGPDRRGDALAGSMPDQAKRGGLRSGVAVMD